MFAKWPILAERAPLGKVSTAGLTRPGSFERLEPRFQWGEDSDVLLRELLDMGDPRKIASRQLERTACGTAGYSGRLQESAHAAEYGECRQKAGFAPVEPCLTL